MAAVTPLQRWTRDDWLVPCTVQDRSGTAINLTGYTIAAEYWFDDQKAYNDLTVSSGGIQRVSDAGGQFNVCVSRLMTAGALQPFVVPAPQAPRLLIYWIDAYQKRQTLGTISFDVLNAYSDSSISEIPPVTIVYLDATFQIIVATPQGPAGPSSIAAAQVSDASAIGQQIMTAANPGAIRSLLNVFGNSAKHIVDTNYNMAASDTFVGMKSLTASRNVYLVDVTTYPDGQALTIAAEDDTCSDAQKINLVPAAGQTIGGQSSLAIVAPRQKLILHSNGTNEWLI